MTVLSAATAKRTFLTVCRETLDNGERTYVQDKSKTRFMTLDPERRRLKGPVLDVTAQFFKDHFSRCSALVRNGLCFRLSLRGRTSGLYARRYVGYRDPCDGLIRQWQELVAKEHQESAILAIVKRLDLDAASTQEGLRKGLQDLKLGIARMAIGDRPFEEGRLPDDGWDIRDVPTGRQAAAMAAEDQHQHGRSQVRAK